MILGLFIVAFFCLLTAFLLFDKILRFQYKNYRIEWEKNGKAIGFLWVPPDSSLWSGSFARNTRVLSWTFGSDEWMKKEPKILRTALLMRLLIFACWILGIVAFIFANKSK